MLIKLALVLVATAPTALGWTEPQGNEPAEGAQSAAAEIRQLRVSMERLAGLAAQAFGLARRLDSQHHKVDALESEVRAIERQIGMTAADQARAEATMHSLELRQTGMAMDTNSPFYQQWQAEMNGTQGELKRITLILDQLRRSQSELLPQIRDEKKSLADLESRMNSIEGSLSAFTHR